MISTNVYTFDEYHIFQKEQRAVQCYVPLQVVIADDELTRSAFAQVSKDYL